VALNIPCEHFTIKKSLLFYQATLKPRKGIKIKNKIKIKEKERERKREREREREN
jgi:hypothetical protein